jgi:hypothetical protein
MTAELDLPDLKDLSPERFAAEADELVDAFEVAMSTSEFPPLDFPLTHRFTPGLYIREIFMPAGSLLTSKIHKTEHPFVISKGVVSVWTKETGAVLYRAPHTGITYPGTRRVLFVHEDTIWTTFHVGDETTVEEFEARIIEPRVNALTQMEELKCLG